MEALSRRGMEFGMRFFGLEVKGYLSLTRDVARKKKTTFTILLDDRRIAREVLHIPGTPSTLVVDAKGNIRAKLFGASQDLDKVVEDVIIRI